jgi:hypothetical protein
VRRLVCVKAAVALVLVVAAAAAQPASGGVIRPTAPSAASAAAKKFVLHDIRAWNRAGISYTLLGCRVLHRRPWVAYGCRYEVHGIPSECLDLLTLGVKRLADGSYRAEALKWRDLRDTC